MGLGEGWWVRTELVWARSGLYGLIWWNAMDVYKSLSSLRETGHMIITCSHLLLLNKKITT